MKKNNYVFLGAGICLFFWGGMYFSSPKFDFAHLKLSRASVVHPKPKSEISEEMKNRVIRQIEEAEAYAVKTSSSGELAAANEQQQLNLQFQAKGISLEPRSLPKKSDAAKAHSAATQACCSSD